MNINLTTLDCKKNTSTEVGGIVAENTVFSGSNATSPHVHYSPTLTGCVTFKSTALKCSTTIYQRCNSSIASRISNKGSVTDAYM